ncbi:unnamed protein product [Acanthoscelides obtectus]|uniref:Uncharacterized protein n=1 Tax=Acanthoscelides obtectus TaxID=200917 RepID=A0A9P0PGG7_ACAOB|nr:unnamed protein product [Acanthoscelides obtectus]CAK1656742.1 hypothetical protein AOBTE_LOCUS19892 [Acanthoscelides obtectus]
MAADAHDRKRNTEKMEESEGLLCKGTCSSTKSEKCKKRRKYIYFDLLLFLLPSMNDRPTSSNTAPIENTNDNV